MATIYQNGIQYSGSGEPLIYDDMGGATSTTGGVHGLVPAPSAGDNEKFLSGDGSWKKPGEYITKTATGNSIELTDAASAPLVKCVTQITGSQDLHGYDKPWVGGAGKNKLPMVLADIKNTQSPATSQGSWSGDSYVTNGVTFKINTDNAGNVTSILATGSTTNDNATLVLYGTNVTSEKDIVFSQPFIVSDGANGSATTFRGIVWGTEGTFIDGEEVSFNAMTIYGFGIRIMAGYTLPSGGVMFYPMIRLSTETDPTFTPYSNICPITAYTEGEIEVRGKNLFDKDASGNVANKYLNTTNGNLKASTSGWGTSDYIPVNENTTYATNVVPFIGSGQSAEICAYDESKVFISGVSNRLGNYTTPPNTAFIRIDYVGSAIDNIQLELGSTATTYEPYTSTAHTTTYPSAIYRGSEDVVKGEVTSDMLCDDLGDFTWTKASGFSNKDVFYTPLSSLSGVPKHVIYQVPNAISSVAIATYQQAPVWEIGTFVFVGIEGVLPANTLGFIVPLGAYSDATAFKTAMTGQKIAYEIATPTTTLVTPTNLPIKSLSGYNHIESSTGDMEVEYITEEYQPLVDLIADGGGTSSDDYITEETLIGSWLGTPLYRRVIEISGNKASGGYYTLLNDSTINLIKYEGCVQNQYWTGAGCMLNSYYSESQYCGCAYSSNDGARIDWYNNLGMTISKIYLIIYYTKK